MGMYDYLGGEQIKIFYRPIFSKSGVMGEGPGTWHSGGGLRSFEENDELPLRTIYYQYPDNFLVFDYRFDNEDVWIIKNGKFDRIISYKLLKEEDIFGPVFDYYGGLLEIHMVSEFSQIKNECKEVLEKQKEIEKSFFPNGVIDAIKNDRDLYEKHIESYEAAHDNNRRKLLKWFPEDKYRKLKDLGEVIDCFIFARERKHDEQFTKFINPMEDYIACAGLINKQIEEHPSIIEEYTKWINDEKLLEDIHFKELIKEAQEIANNKTDIE